MLDSSTFRLDTNLALVKGTFPWSFVYFYRLEAEIFLISLGYQFLDSYISTL